MQLDQISAPEFVRSLEERSYVLVDVSEEVRLQVDRTFAAAGRFFRQPLNLKLGSRQSNDTGYRPFGVEFSSTSERPDLMESFTVADDSKTISDSGTSCSAELAKEMMRTLDLTRTIAEQSLQPVLQVYDQAASVQTGGIFDRWSILQLNYSRPSELEGTRINDVHEDGCLLTVGAMPSAGLELRAADESYSPITTAHNQLIIMAGEILSLMSGGRIQPCFHRVRTVPYLLERMSLLMFADISPELCAPWVRTPANEEIDIGSRVLTNSTRFGLQEWTADRHG